LIDTPFEAAGSPRFISEKTDMTSTARVKPNLAARVRHAAATRLQLKQVEKILKQAGPTSTDRSESQFDVLQKAIKPRAFDYEYSPLNIWNRANQRVSTLLALPGLEQRPRHILEVGCGDAMTGLLLQTYGHEVQLTDLDDWRCEQAKTVPIHVGRLEEGLPYADGQFDLAFSYNTFEHVDDPAVCLEAIAKKVKPGGLIYLDFGPLFASPWGLHAYRTIHTPYAQFLFGQAFVIDKIKSLGHRDLGVDTATLQPMNQWRKSQFDELWNQGPWRVERLRYLPNKQSLQTVKQFPEAFRGRGLTSSDLVMETCRVVLRMPE